MDFPALEPTSRTWTPGSEPVVVNTHITGFETRVLLGSSPVNAQLSLTFANRLEADSNQITAHYLAVRGTFETFDLPPEVFAGMTTYNFVKPATHKWRYISAPTVEYVSPGISSVTVSLMAVYS